MLSEPSVAIYNERWPPSLLCHDANVTDEFSCRQQFKIIYFLPFFLENETTNDFKHVLLGHCSHGIKSVDLVISASSNDGWNVITAEAEIKYQRLT